MVMRYGMSDKLGPLVYGRKEELIFLGKEISEQRDYSDALAEEIDREVSKLVRTTLISGRRRSSTSPAPKWMSWPAV